MDHVTGVLAQWAEQRPDLDVSSMAVVGRLSRLAGITGAAMARTFAAHDLDGAQFDVLATLRRSDPARGLTPAELAQSSMVTSGAVSQRLDKLERRGLVERGPSPTDRRAVRVTLTPLGQEVIDTALPAHVRTQDSLVAGLTPTQQDELAELLRTLLETLGDRLDGHTRPAPPREPADPLS